MRITFLTPHLNLSGGVKMILGYADRLARKGHRVSVICPQRSFLQRVWQNCLKSKPNWIEMAAAIKYVPSYEEKYLPDADAVIATAWQTASFVNHYSSQKGKKFYFIQHYESLFHGDKRQVDQTYLYPLKKIVVSTWIKKILKKKLKVDSQLILNPIDLEVFYPTRKSSQPDKRIGMLYHPFDWKGVPDGIKAFKIAQKKFPKIQLVMFGTFEKPPAFDCEYHYRPLNDELRKIYNSCDLFLCPSWVEGFSLPSAEAMACGCALVTTDNGGCRDYAFHNRTALVSPPQKPTLLAENLIKLIHDGKTLRKIAQNGQELISKFTWNKALGKMGKVFQN